MFEVKNNGNTASIYTPYNAEFVRRVKNAGGRWDANEKCWAVPSSAVDAVREIMRDVYGRDDVDAGQTVKVRLTFEDRVHGDFCEPLTIYGHTISRAFGRDSGARAGEGVYFIKGCPISSGSVKNWTSSVEAGSIVEINDAQRSLVETETLPKDITVEIMPSSTEIDADALNAERARLAARIAEIDALLGSA